MYMDNDRGAAVCEWSMWMHRRLADKKREAPLTLMPIHVQGGMPTGQ